jgi:hypothetical protein
MVISTKAYLLVLVYLGVDAVAPAGLSILLAPPFQLPKYTWYC